ncbi:Wzz/FepE/Etk N-terminal domain-containing protein [Actinoplanes sp. NPDC051470]|uniref:Wzz/FepE/Etk N-terminal domain-containing protein n=1 Tax=unclassified Actinoplanes TaxID=2626549 RepID=UPI00342F8EA5
MEARPGSADLSHYVGMFRRHWWVVLAATGAGLGLGAALTSTLPRVYESSTSVLVSAVEQDTNQSGGRTKGSINLDTEAQLVGSGAVAVKAAALLRSTGNPLELAHAVSVEVPANTTVLVITFEADTPQKAQAGSHAFAEAYLRNREQTARSGLDSQIKSLSLKIRQLTTNLTSINARLAKAKAGSSERSNLESLRSNSQNQLNSMTGRLNELTTTTVAAGSIISDARVPTEPTSPNTMLNIAAGAMLGLLAGLMLAFARERLDRRLRTAADVRDRARMPVLAALDERTTPHFDDVLQPYGPGGRVFNRLRNEVLASLDPDDKIIVVTGASRGSASTLVAANLAAALARTGSDVVLIGAHLPDSVVDAAPLARMLGVNAVPGLSDLLAGRVTLSRAMQRMPRIPSLRVITTGGAATAAGLMQSQRLRDTLEALRRQTGYVVIEAPSTSSSADAQSLASLADAAILAVELRKSRRPMLTDAAEQLRRVGTPLLGAVVLPRLVGLRADEIQPPAVALTPLEKAMERQSPEVTAVLDAERTMRFPTTTVPRQGKDAHEDPPTAVIELTPPAKKDDE